MSSSWLAVTAEGAAKRVGGLGLLVGRAPTCDLVLDHPGVSRRHLLLQFGFRGQLDIVPMPGAPTTLNGATIDTPAEARDDDTLGFPGGTTIRLKRELGARVEPSTAWLLDVGGRRIGLRGDTIRLGSGVDDDVVIDAWPASIAILALRDAAWTVASTGRGLSHNGIELATEHPVVLHASDRIAFGGRSVAILADAADPEPTRRDDDRPRKITLEMLPSGGMVSISSSAGDRRVVLAERRYALVSVLLVPPSPFRAGEFIPDEVAFGAVWPRNDSVDRSDLNQLVFRLRSDLTAAGIDGASVIDRFAKGGATRFVLETGTLIETVA